MIPDLKALWDSMVITSHRFADPVAAISIAEARYQAVEKNTGVPWQIIGCLHQREGSGDFSTHLHNGDSLRARTVHVPEGRPIDGNPPFEWEFSACDALAYDNLSGLTGWDNIAIALYRIERFNGLGYRSHGINSPYLWAGTNHYSVGKFDADSHFDPTEVDQQPGCAGLLKLLGFGIASSAPASGMTVTPNFGPSITVEDQAVS